MLLWHIIETSYDDKTNKTEHPSRRQTLRFSSAVRQGQDIPDGEMRPGEQLLCP